MDIAGLEDEQGLLNAIDDAAVSCGVSTGGRPVVFRLALTGRGPLHRRLRREGTVDHIQERLNEQFANAQPWLWCERIQVTTAAPVSIDRIADREDFVGDLARLARELRESSEGLAELQGLLQGLYGSNRARRYLRGLLPENDELLELLSAAEEECIAELVDDEDDA